MEEEEPLRWPELEVPLRWPTLEEPLRLPELEEEESIPWPELEEEPIRSPGLEEEPIRWPELEEPLRWLVRPLGRESAPHRLTSAASDRGKFAQSGRQWRPALS